MNEITYAQAYTEVLEVLKHLPKVQYDKISKDKIEFYKNNCDDSYSFKLDKDLKNLSMKANAIIISIYKEYFTSEKQKEILKNILKENSREAEELKREKYNPDNLFKNNSVKKEMLEEQENTQIIEYKEENIFQKFFSKMKEFFNKLKR